MAMLMLGAFRARRRQRAAGELAGDRSSAVAAAGVLVPDAAAARTFFDGAFVVDGFGRFMKLLILGGSALRCCSRSTILARQAA